MAKVKRKRDYKRERELAIRRGETGVGPKSGDAMRHKARRKVEKVKGDLPSDIIVDHAKVALKDGGTNAMSNLRIRKLKDNASEGGRQGDPKKKGQKKP